MVTPPSRPPHFHAFTQGWQPQLQTDPGGNSHLRSAAFSSLCQIRAENSLYINMLRLTLNPSAPISSVANNPIIERQFHAETLMLTYTEFPPLLGTWKDHISPH